MQEISVEQLRARIDKNEKLNLIDVREEWEAQEFNIGAQNIPLSVFMTRLEDLEPLRNQEIILHCKMGSRSTQAAMILEQLGFKNVKNLKGGMEAWIAATR